jgi:hypothetical protein
VSDIDIAMVDSLKVLDPNRPIREADVVRAAAAYEGSQPAGYNVRPFVPS